MIEHPVPQNVTGYQFHLIGDMTVKQFAELAGGVLAAWLVWSLNLPAVLRWPLSILAALSGFALAFMPVEDRPLDQWVVAFFRAAYRPTLFTWKKSIRSDILQFTPKTAEKKEVLSAAVKAPAAGLQTLLQAYQMEAASEGNQDPLELDWLKRQEAIPALFQQVQVPRKLSAETTFPKLLYDEPERPITRPSLHPLNPPENPEAIIKGEITLSPRQPKLPTLILADYSSTQESSSASHVEPTGASTQPVAPPNLPSLSAATASHPAAVSATTHPSMPLPTTEYPNIITGMVLTADERIVEGAIIEIRDSHGLPVRALKTNKLGQFSIATALANGTYELEIEKEGLAFDILKLEADGEVIPPLAIRAK